MDAICRRSILGSPMEVMFFRQRYMIPIRVLASVELPFEILRPWYLSYWAVGSYILAGLCLLALLQYLVYRFVKKKERPCD